MNERRNIIDDVLSTLNCFGEQINNVFTRIMDKVDESVHNLSPSYLKPKYDIVDLHDEYYIRIEIPGVDDKSLYTELIERSVCIYMKKTRPIITDPHEIIYTNRSYGMCRLYIIMPKQVERKNITPFYNDGVLTIIFNKCPRRNVLENEPLRMRDDLDNDNTHFCENNYDNYEESSESFEVFIDHGDEE